MTDQRHRAVGMVAALLVALLALSGCGAASDDAATTAADDASESTALPGAGTESKATAESEPETEEPEPETEEPEPETEEPEPETEEPEPETEEPESETEEPEDEAPAGQTATDEDLDAYVASAEKAARKIYGDMFDELYSEIGIVPVYPNGIEYDYTFRAAVDPATAKRQLALQAPTLRTQARTVIIPEMEQQGFADPTVAFTYRNPDGSVVWSRTFS